MAILHEQFEDLDKQDHAARLGMWLFLASELLLFAGFFGLYVAYRAMYGAEFVHSARHNDLILGTTNTIVLITSSFTVAWAVHAMRHGRPRTTVLMLGATLVFGAAFMVIKTVEYGRHFQEGIFPGVHFRHEALDTYGARTFFTLYYLMTGLHALHVLVGMGVIAFVLVMARRGLFAPERHAALENAGLYWHLVDLIWIYLWPLLYVVR